jgi:hypothetical protein
MAFEVRVDFSDDLGCEARVADQYDRLQMVGSGAQPTALGGGQFGHRVRLQES